MQRVRRSESLHGGRGYVTEVAGRDRHKFFCNTREAGVGIPATLVMSAADGNGDSDLMAQPRAPVLRLTLARDGLSGGQSGNRFHSMPPAARLGSASGRAGSKRSAPYYAGEDAAEVMATVTATGEAGVPREVAVQTMFAERDVQTDPYTPDFVIHPSFEQRQLERIAAGRATTSEPLYPEELDLAGLTYNNGLPAGQEEVALIERIRRRRAVAAQLPQGTDDATMEQRLKMLHDLEHAEWQDREAHFQLQLSRRNEHLTRMMNERDDARNDVAQDRLERMREQKYAVLASKLEQLHSKRLATVRRLTEGKKTGSDRVGLMKSGVATYPGPGSEAAQAPLGSSHAPGGEPLAATAGARVGLPGSNSRRSSKRRDLIRDHAVYGPSAHPVVSNSILQVNDPLNSVVGRPGKVGGILPPARPIARAYDVRPSLLSTPEWVQELEETGAVKQHESIRETHLQPPENLAIRQLKTYYQRREAAKVVEALEYATGKTTRGADLLGDDSATHTTSAARHRSRAADAPGDGVDLAVTAANVHELYRAPPKPKRPDTPVLELEGGLVQEEEEAIILLQRLLRGRATQNDFFEGRERCRGLIGELQAASEAKEVSKVLQKETEQLAQAQAQEDEAAAILDVASGSVFQGALGFLHAELRRRQDAHRIDQCRVEAEETRAQREQDELRRRETERALREQQEVQFAAYTQITDSTIESFLHNLYTASTESVAEQQAIREEVHRITVEEGLAPPPAGAVELTGFGRTREPPTAAQRETMVCDMLDQFLFPLVCDEVRDAGAQLVKQQAPTAVAYITAVDCARSLEQVTS